MLQPEELYELLMSRAKVAEISYREQKEERMRLLAMSPLWPDASHLAHDVMQLADVNKNNEVPKVLREDRAYRSIVVTLNFVAVGMPLTCFSV